MMRRGLKVWALGVAALVAAVAGVKAPAAFAVSPATSQIAVQVAEHVIAPRFAKLDDAFRAQATAWSQGCANPQELREAYQTAYDSWASVEFFRAGPLSQQTRAERIDHWPDPRNFIEKGLRAVLAAPSAAEITPQSIASASVAVQGLPALERILFDDKEAKSSLDEKACAAGRAIAQNLAGIGEGLDREWNDATGGELNRLRETAKDEAKAREAAVGLLTDLATGIRVLEDRKLPPLFGGRENMPNPKAAKAWRSARSERDLAVNLTALIDAYAALGPYVPQSSASVVEKLNAAKAALAAKDDPNRAIALLAAVNNAKYYAVDVLPSDLGLTLGFNSLDGD